MTTLADINKTLQQTQESVEQSAASSAAVAKYLEKWIKQTEESRGDDLEKERKQERAKAAKAATPAGFKGALKASALEVSGVNFFSDLISNTFGSVLGNLSDQGIGLKIATAVGTIAGRGLIFGPLAGAVALFGEDLLMNVFETLDPEDIFSDQDKQSIATSLSSATRNGLMAAMFGRRAGISAFVGTLVGDALSKTFNLSDERKIELFGFELPITEQDFATWGSTIASFFAPSLISSSISSQLTGRPTVGRDPRTGRFTALKPSFANSFRSNFVPRAGWAVVLSGAGSIIANVVASQFEDPEVQAQMESTIGGTFNAAAFGLMLAGPWGALAASIGYLAVVGLNKLADWMRGQDQKVRHAAYEELAKYEAMDIESMTSEDVAAAREAAGRALQEANRVPDLAMQSPEERALAAEMAQRATDLAAALPDANVGSLLQAANTGSLDALDRAIRILYEERGVAAEDLASFVTDLSQLDWDQANALGEQAAQRWQDLYQMTVGDPLQIPTTGHFWWKEQDYGALLPPSRDDTAALDASGSGASVSTVVGQIGDTKVVNNNSSQGIILNSTERAYDPYDTLIGAR